MFYGENGSRILVDPRTPPTVKPAGTHWPLPLLPSPAPFQAEAHFWSCHPLIEIPSLAQLLLWNNLRERCDAEPPAAAFSSPSLLFPPSLVYSDGFALSLKKKKKMKEGDKRKTRKRRRDLQSSELWTSRLAAQPGSDRGQRQRR